MRRGLMGERVVGVSEEEVWALGGGVRCEVNGRLNRF